MQAPRIGEISGCSLGNRSTSQFKRLGSNGLREERCSLKLLHVCVVSGPDHHTQLREWLRNYRQVSNTIINTNHTTSWRMNAFWINFKYPTISSSFLLATYVARLLPDLFFSFSFPSLQPPRHYRLHSWLLLKGPQQDIDNIESSKLHRWSYW